MTVSIATSGEISTDFSIEIEHRPFEEPGKRGRVRLLRLQRQFHPSKTKQNQPTTREN